MNVSEVLNKAADHIERYGHHKGGALRGADYRTAAACAVGALSVVTLPSRSLLDPACHMLRDYLGGQLVSWNDAPDRTAAEVVEALRACAVIEAARETEGRLIHGPVIEPVREAVA